MKKIVIAGGSGLVGQILARGFRELGDDPVILTRQAAPDIVGRVVSWKGCDLGSWVEELNGADVVINLAGRSVNCRYDARSREEIIRSRVESTRVIGEAIGRVARPPSLWLQAGTATIYRHRYDAPNDESSAIPGEGEENIPKTWRFSLGVATAWERAFNDARVPSGVRKVLLRSSLVLSPDRGGVLDVLLGLVRHGLGGRMGDGRQFVSWIHDADFFRAVCWLMAQNDFDGIVNLASPNPLPNGEFMRILREAWGTSVGLPAPDWLLEIGAFFLRTETELILKSRRVISRRLLDAGFEFQFPEWNKAADDLCRRWRRG